MHVVYPVHTGLVYAVLYRTFLRPSLPDSTVADWSQDFHPGLSYSAPYGAEARFMFWRTSSPPPSPRRGSYGVIPMLLSRRDLLLPLAAWAHNDRPERCRRDSASLTLSSFLVNGFTLNSRTTKGLP